MFSSDYLQEEELMACGWKGACVGKGAGCRKKTGKVGGTCVEARGCARVCREKARTKEELSHASKIA